MTSDNQNDQQQQDQKVELAVFNLESTTHLTDQQMIAHQVERYLQACGQTSLSQVQGGANVPMVANIYALTGSVLDLVLYATQPFEGDAGVKQTALMAANLIGLFLSPQNEAHARVALRPMLGVMAECLYKDGGKIREGDLKRMALHLNAHIAGDLEDFLIETAGKLPGLLASATTLGTSILTGLTVSTSGGAASGGASADQRDPNQQFMNWASPLAELLQLPSAADLTPKIPVVDVAPSFLQIKATAALATLANAIQQHGSPLKYSLSWLIGQTLQALKDNKNKGNASVPINQTGEYERHSKGDTLEFVTLQANALNAPPCQAGTGSDINYAIGAERVGM